MGSANIVVVFVFTQRVQEVRLVPDQGVVERFVTAGLDPPLHDRVHSRNPDTGEHDRDASVGENGVEQGGVLAVAIRAEDTDPAGGVFDDRQYVQSGAGQGGGWMRRS